MKITIVGAGAVGGYFGGRWQQAGFDVTYLVRPGRADQLQSEGLVIQSPFGDAILTPNVVTSVSEIDACHLVVLAVKNYHLDGRLLADVGALADRGAYVLPLLNGIEHFDRLQKACGTEKVLGGVVQIISTLNERGHIVHTNQLHHVSFGPLSEGQQEFCDKLVEASAPANFALRLSENVQVDIWQKYAFITAFSGVTTASRLSIDQIVSSEPTLRVFTNVLEELQQLARAQGVELPAAFADGVLANIRRMPEGATSSMHQDFRKGLPIEVDSLQGAAVRLSHQLRVPAPVVQTLHGLLVPYQNGQR